MWTIVCILVPSVHKLRVLFFFQDNVFVNVVASIQYRALSGKGPDAFYKLSNSIEQIQAYVFDGVDAAFIFFVAMKKFPAKVPTDI